MSKAVYKLRPSDYWRIGEHESWFQDMAAKGIHLEKMGLYFARFVKDEPKKMRYRIEGLKKVTPEQIELYEESGWNYVTSYQFFHVFSSPVDSGAPELHTDPAEQSYTLKELDKKLMMSASMVVISLMLIIGMLSSIWFLDGTPTLVLVEGRVIQQTILAIFIGYLAYTSLQAAISIRILRKDLSIGKPVDHHAPWEKHFRKNSVIAFLFIIVIGLTVILPFMQLAKGETKTLPEEAGDSLPIVRLADVEQNPALIRGESEHMSNDVDWSNRYSYDWSPLAPVQYETDENGVVPGEMWRDGSGEYTPSMSTKIFQLRFPGMANQLISDLIKWYTYDESSDGYIETRHPELDYLVVHEKEGMKEVIASKGKAVMYVRYHGYGEIDRVIEVMVEKMTMISE